MKQFSSVVLLALCSLLFACGKEESAPAPAPESSVAAAEAGNPAAEQAATEIQGDYMRGIVAEISQDSYEGRGPGSRGDEKARRYLEAQLAALGLEPGAADGSWEQSFELVGLKTAQPDAWVFSKGDKELALKQWDQFIVGSGVQEERVGIADAEVVFVGYGIQAPEYDWDDYKGVDLKGKVLLMMNNDPPLVRPLGL